MKKPMSFLISTALLAACGSTGDPGPAGAPGPASLIQTDTEPAGDNCAAGGVAVRVGLDADADGELSDAEISDTSYLCNGETGQAGEEGGAGSGALVETADATECGDAGGTLLRVGVDNNGDGALQDEEVESEREVCNSAAGAEGPILVAESSLAPGGVCFAGGSSLDIGRDLDGNGALDEAEIESNLTTCDPCPLGYGEDPTDANNCVPARTIVFEGVIDDVFDDSGLAPPIAVGDRFEGKIILYGSNVPDTNPNTQMGEYSFSGVPSSFVVELPGNTLSSLPASELSVAVNDDFGFTLQDEYIVSSSANETLGTLVVESLDISLYDWDGTAFVGDGMRTPPAMDEWEQLQFSVVVSSGQDAGPGPGPGPGPGGSIAVAFGELTYLRSY